jgi:hypothetical protein
MYRGHARQRGGRERSRGGANGRGGGAQMFAPLSQPYAPLRQPYAPHSLPYAPLRQHMRPSDKRMHPSANVCAPQPTVCPRSNPDHPTWQRCGSQHGQSKSRFTLSKVNKTLILIGRTRTLSDVTHARTHAQTTLMMVKVLLRWNSLIRSMKSFLR